MRRLEKGDKPEILQKNEVSWTQEYLDAVTASLDPLPRRWGHPQVKNALRKETHGKCAYCEASPHDVSYAHVEHIIPRNSRPDLVVSWRNLTHACGVCNTEKSDNYDPNCPLLDPYDDYPDEHLIFLGTIVGHHPGDARGELMWRTLKLNRLDLANARSARIMSVLSLLDKWESATGALKDELEQTIRDDVELGEFTRSVQAMLETTNFPLP